MKEEMLNKIYCTIDGYLKLCHTSVISQYRFNRITDELQHQNIPEFLIFDIMIILEPYLKKSVDLKDIKEQIKKLVDEKYA